MTRIYLAGPLFCESEREYNRKLKRELEAAGFEVVLPQDCEVRFSPERMSDKDYAMEVAETIFKGDLALVDSCDVLVFNLDGRVPDEGACVELGYAYARGKKLYGIKTDDRVAEFGIDNMMISGMLLDNLVRSVEELVKKIKE